MKARTRRSLLAATCITMFSAGAAFADDDHGRRNGHDDDHGHGHGRDISVSIGGESGVSLSVGPSGVSASIGGNGNDGNGGGPGGGGPGGGGPGGGDDSAGNGGGPGGDGPGGGGDDSAGNGGAPGGGASGSDGGDDGGPVAGGGPAPSAPPPTASAPDDTQDAASLTSREPAAGRQENEPTFSASDLVASMPQVGEWSLGDFSGTRVRGADGAEIGTVEAVVADPSGNLYLVTALDSQDVDGRERLIPLNRFGTDAPSQSLVLGPDAVQLLPQMAEMASVASAFRMVDSDDALRALQASR